MTISFGTGVQTYDSELGEFISEAHVHLAAVISDYKPTLSLVYIPREKRDATDTKPWAILERDERFGEHIIRYLSDEEMRRPDEVLAWVFEGDLDKHRPNDVLARIEARENAAKLLELKREEERIEDQQDLVAFLGSGGRDKKHWFRHNGTTYRN